ncbi:MAG TPA: PaaI family thioesterase [Noviherbaspirillum sp.]|nr:PaaI family thioesterase [Noviherbaspirillum sp.]
MSEQAQALARLEEEMRRPPFHAVLAPQAHAVDPESGEVVIRLPFHPDFGRDPVHVGFHGGVIASLIDLAGHAAVAVKVGKPTPTVDLRIDYLRPAPGVTLEARARVLRAGRAIARADIDVLADGVLVAVGRGTFSTL